LCTKLRCAKRSAEMRIDMLIGNHLSASKGYAAMGKAALALDANTFAFFTRNPRGGKAKEIDEKDVEKFLNFAKEHEFGKIVAHAPYTMNLCAAKEDVRSFSKEMLLDDLKRMEYTPYNYYNFHPGSHVGQGAEKGIALIAEALNEALKPEQTTTVLLETMAGKGTEVGRTFEELREILDRVELNDKMGVCLDTCHVWDGGYDIVNDLDDVLNEFDRVIGLDRLKAVHFNDSMNDCGSHKDRHAKIGEGKIGAEAMRRVALHPLLEGRPFILETPNDDEGYRREIQMVREWTR
jgi:deoxyribonuclease-4